MNKLNIEGIKEERIKIAVFDDGPDILVKFTGDIDMEDPGLILDPLFNKIHDGIIEKNIKQVKADFNELGFLNSSGIKSVAKWIMKLADLNDTQKYIIKILYNKDITWQVTSLPTLTFLVPGGVKVE